MDDLEIFLSRIPNLAVIIEKPIDLMPFLGYYLQHEKGQPHFRPADLKSCYEAAQVPSPDVYKGLERSGAFVKTSKGWQLRRDAKVSVQSALTSTTPTLKPTETVAATKATPVTSQDVFVVHGRDLGLRDAMFALLRAMKLNPIEWEPAIAKTGETAPYVGQVLDTAFSVAQAFIVLLSPDECASLRPELQSEKGDGEIMFQPRPNVLLEAGMALARDAKRTIIVQIGPMRTVSDVLGRHVLHFSGSPTERNALATRLRTAGCTPTLDGSDWLNIGKFTPKGKLPSQKKK